MFKAKSYKEGLPPMKIPTDYTIGYEKARAIAPDIADKYVAHTLIGDPLGEEMAADLEAFSASESERLIQVAMNEEGEEALRDAPDSLRRFFKEAGTPPEWLDYSAFAPSVRMFYRNSQIVLAAFVVGLSYKTLKFHAFTVTGGSVKKAQRMDRDSDTPNIRWLITVQPNGNGDVTITLPVTTDCTDDGAICTGDGRMLSNSLIFAVSDPN